MGRGRGGGREGDGWQGKEWECIGKCRGMRSSEGGGGRDDDVVGGDGGRDGLVAR